VARLRFTHSALIGAIAVVGLIGGAVAAAGASGGTGADTTQAHQQHVHKTPAVPTGPAAPSAGPAGGLTPRQVTAAYNLGPLTASGITGTGQTIVIVDSFGSPTIKADLAKFDTYYNLPAPPTFRVIHPAGRVPPFHSSSNRDGWAGETTLDVEWAHVMAPGASILLVETPTSENEGTTGFPQIVKAEKYVLNHKLGQVISQSFSATEQTFATRQSLLNLRGAYKLAARDHVTVLTATGDQGATGDTYNMKNLYTTRAVAWPATDPLVTAVGGTRLYLRTDGSRKRTDVAWNLGGGGKSKIFARPSYQYGVRGVTGSRRGVPDISLDASCASAVSVYGSYDRNAGSWSTACGTSLATPLFAGIVALADQVAGHGHAHGLGLINPAIYKIAARHDPGVVDVRVGNNTISFTQQGRRYTVHGFPALQGYDLVSGVGTVNAAKFVPELAQLAG